MAILFENALNKNISKEKNKRDVISSSKFFILSVKIYLNLVLCYAIW